MVRTRRLHARLAYHVVRVDNRASIKKYSAFGARHQREDLSARYAPRQLKLGTRHAKRKL
jgi:hypothetical protein